MITTSPMLVNFEEDSDTKEPAKRESTDSIVPYDDDLHILRTNEGLKTDSEDNQVGQGSPEPTKDKDYLLKNDGGEGEEEETAEEIEDEIEGEIEGEIEDEITGEIEDEIKEEIENEIEREIEEKEKETTVNGEGAKEKEEGEEVPHGEVGDDLMNFDDGSDMFDDGSDMFDDGSDMFDDGSDMFGDGEGDADMWSTWLDDLTTAIEEYEVEEPAFHAKPILTSFHPPEEMERMNELEEQKNRGLDGEYQLSIKKKGDHSKEDMMKKVVSLLKKSVPPCPENFFYYKDKCYRISTFTASRKEALTLCHTLESKLVSVTDPLFLHRLTWEMADHHIFKDCESCHFWTNARLRMNRWFWGNTDKMVKFEKRRTKRQLKAPRSPVRENIQPVPIRSHATKKPTVELVLQKVDNHLAFGMAKSDMANFFICERPACNSTKEKKKEPRHHSGNDMPKDKPGMNKPSEHTTEERPMEEAPEKHGSHEEHPRHPHTENEKHKEEKADETTAQPTTETEPNHETTSMEEPAKEEEHDHGEEEHDHGEHDHGEHDHESHDHESHDHESHDHESHDHESHDHESHDHHPSDPHQEEEDHQGHAHPE